jgi:hypothetical protein
MVLLAGMLARGHVSNLEVACHSQNRRSCAAGGCSGANCRDVGAPAMQTRHHAASMLAALQPALIPAPLNHQPWAVLEPRHSMLQALPHLNRFNIPVPVVPRWAGTTVQGRQLAWTTTASAAPAWCTRSGASAQPPTTLRCASSTAPPSSRRWAWQQVGVRKLRGPDVGWMCQHGE